MRGQSSLSEVRRTVTSIRSGANELYDAGRERERDR